MIIKPFRTWATEWETRLFLLDASGVLYSDKHLLLGVPEAVSWMWSRGSVGVVTNNTCDSPQEMEAHFQHKGIRIKQEDILSSGASLKGLPEFHAQIQGKKVFMWGKPGSGVYVGEAGGQLVSEITQAEVVVIASSSLPTAAQMVERIAAYVKANPSVPVICCNPDRFVIDSEGGLYPVAGYFAHQVEEHGVSVQWVGKPLDNYCELVNRRFLTSFSGQRSQAVFCDDNPYNVVALKTYLGIKGIWVKGSGIGEKAFTDLEIQTLLPQIDGIVEEIE